MVQKMPIVVAINSCEELSNNRGDAAYLSWDSKLRRLELI
jgi:hypothetical protein